MTDTADSRSHDNTVLVTGITGFVAGHIAVRLQEGYRVRGTLRSMQRLTRAGLDEAAPTPFLSEGQK